MKQIIKDAFEKELKYCYANIFEQFKIWNSNGINEQNLTCNFVNSLKTSLKDDNAVTCFEVLLQNERSRIDAIVLSLKHNAIFFIESKRFKRSQPKYQTSLKRDIDRILDETNRKWIIDNVKSSNVLLNQYIICICDHWRFRDSDVKIKDWFSKFEENSLMESAEYNNLRNEYMGSFESLELKDETYMFFIMALKLNY